MNAAQLKPLAPLPKLFAPHETEAEAEAYANRFKYTMVERHGDVWRVRRFDTKDEVRATGHEPCAVMATPSMLLGLDRQPGDKLATYYVARVPEAKRPAPIRATGEGGARKAGSVATCRDILAADPDISRDDFVQAAISRGVLLATAKIQYGRIRAAQK